MENCCSLVLVSSGIGSSTPPRGISMDQPDDAPPIKPTRSLNVHGYRCQAKPPELVPVAPNVKGVRMGPLDQQDVKWYRTAFPKLYFQGKK